MLLKDCTLEQLNQQRDDLVEMYITEPKTELYHERLAEIDNWIEHKNLIMHSDRRLRRASQNKPVVVYSIYSDGSIALEIEEILEKKRIALANIEDPQNKTQQKNETQV